MFSSFLPHEKLPFFLRFAWAKLTKVKPNNSFHLFTCSVDSLPTLFFKSNACLYNCSILFMQFPVRMFSTTSEMFSSSTARWFRRCQRSSSPRWGPELSRQSHGLALTDLLSPQDEERQTVFEVCLILNNKPGTPGHLNLHEGIFFKEVQWLKPDPALSPPSLHRAANSSWRITLSSSLTSSGTRLSTPQRKMAGGCCDTWYALSSRPMSSSSHVV